MNERQLRERLTSALGEPPGAGAAVQRLEAHLHRAAEGGGDQGAVRGHPRGLALLAGALGLMLVAGLLATQAARIQRRVPAPASPPAIVPMPGCMSGAPDELIVIDLQKQRLVAYDHGCPFLTTPITTGSRAAPSTVGTFHVLYKSPMQLLRSPYPPGSPLWYPETPVYDYVAYTQQGDALHSAEWESNSEFGAGSENGPYASHGTVHVPIGALRQLYGWVQIGATVVVESGG